MSIGFFYVSFCFSDLSVRWLFSIPVGMYINETRFSIQSLSLLGKFPRTSQASFFPLVLYYSLLLFTISHRKHQSQAFKSSLPSHCLTSRPKWQFPRGKFKLGSFIGFTCYDCTGFCQDVNPLRCFIRKYYCDYNTAWYTNYRAFISFVSEKCPYTSTIC